MMDPSVSPPEYSWCVLLSMAGNTCLLDSIMGHSILFEGSIELHAQLDLSLPVLGTLSMEEMGAAV
jgi:hypothetical protein